MSTSKLVTEESAAEPVEHTQQSDISDSIRVENSTGEAKESEPVITMQPTTTILPVGPRVKFEISTYGSAEKRKRPHFFCCCCCFSCQCSDTSSD
jgi:hypothetical protein